MTRSRGKEKLGGKGELGGRGELRGVVVFWGGRGSWGGEVVCSWGDGELRGSGKTVR